MLEILIEVDLKRSFEEHGFTFLTPYCIKFLKIDECAAKTFVRIVRKSHHVPELAQTFIRGQISISNAKVISSVISPENKDEWIEKAGKLTKAALEKEVAKVNGVISKKTVLDLPLETIEKLVRGQEIVSTKAAEFVSLEKTIEVAIDEYLYRHDPVEKAARSKCSQGHSKSAVRHAVNDRDFNRCQHIYGDGSQCIERKWIQQHHIIHRADGGPDTLENLVSLCAGHHRLIHKH